MDYSFRSGISHKLLNLFCYPGRDGADNLLKNIAVGGYNFDLFYIRFQPSFSSKIKFFRKNAI